MAAPILTRKHLMPLPTSPISASDNTYACVYATLRRQMGNESRAGEILAGEFGALRAEIAEDMTRQLENVRKMEASDEIRSPSVGKRGRPG